MCQKDNYDSVQKVQYYNFFFRQFDKIEINKFIFIFKQL